MAAKSMIETILDKWPGFYYKETDGVNYKYADVFATLLKMVGTDEYITELKGRLTRPLKLWRVQSLPYVYNIYFEVNLTDIKRVKLYTDSSGTYTLVFDSYTIENGDLTEGTDQYTGYISGKSDTVIPTTKYVLLVEDYHENIFVKGIPENDTPNNDFYDHDPSLDDVWGALYDIPRRTYKSSIDEEDYPNTTPPYHVDLSEPDYYYEERIKDLMSDFQTISLPFFEVKKFFNITPSVLGRWRSVFYMGEDVMLTEAYITANPYDEDLKYMQDSEWNSSVFDVFVNLNNVPTNIEVVALAYIQSIIDMAMPLSKKAYVQYIASEKYGESHEGLYDLVKIGASIFNIPFGLSESLKLKTHVESRPGIYDKISIYGTVEKLVHDTDSDFALDALSDVKISGTGSSAKVILTDFTVKTPSSVDPYYYGVSNPENMCDQDSDYATYNYNYLYSYSFVNLVNCGFNIPTGSTITQIDVTFRRKADNTNKFSNNQNIKLYYSGSERGNPFDATNEYWPSDWETKTYTLTDFGYDWTPARINSSTFGVHLGATTNDLAEKGYVQWVTITVHAMLTDGTLITQTVSSDGLGWRKVETEETVPGQCTLLYDILDADTDGVIIGYNNKTSPVDISSINSDTDIKVKAKFHTNNASYTPELDSITVTARDKIL